MTEYSSQLARVEVPKDVKVGKMFNVEVPEIYRKSRVGGGRYGH